MQTTYHECARALLAVSGSILSRWDKEDFGGCQSIDVETLLGFFSNRVRDAPVPKLMLVTNTLPERMNAYNGIYRSKDVVLRFFTNRVQLEEHLQLMRVIRRVMSEREGEASCVITKWCYGKTVFKSKKMFFAVCDVTSEGGDFVGQTDSYIHSFLSTPFVNRLYLQLYKQADLLLRHGVVLLVHPKLTLVPRNMADGCLGILPFFVYSRPSFRNVPLACSPPMIKGVLVAPDQVEDVVRYNVAKIFTLLFWDKRMFCRAEKRLYTNFVDNYMDMWEQSQKINFRDHSFMHTITQEVTCTRGLASFGLFVAGVKSLEFYKRYGVERGVFMDSLLEAVKGKGKYSNVLRCIYLKYGDEMRPLSKLIKMKVIYDKQKSGCRIVGLNE